MMSQHLLGARRLPNISPKSELTAEKSGIRLQQVVDHLAPLLTRRRITIQASVLAVLVWAGYGVNLATPGLRDRMGEFKGADFLHFYTAGSLLRAGKAIDLYDPAVHAATQKALLPQSAGTYFIPMYGPQFYLLVEPLSALPYAWAALVWALLNTALYFGSCYALLRTCPGLRSESRFVFLLAAAYPAFFSLIAFGQSSAPALALLVLAFLALENRRTFLAGLAIGSLFYKPQLGLASGIILLGAGEGKAIIGAMSAAVAQFGFAWIYFGGQVMKRYLQSFLRLRSAEPFLETKLYQMHSLSSFWSLLLPWRSAAFAFYLISSVAVLVLTTVCWRRGRDRRLVFAMLLLCTVLVSPHLWIYDLVILTPMFLLVAEWIRGRPKGQMASDFWLLLYGCYALPLLGPLAQFTKVQLSVISFAIMVFVLYKTELKPVEAIQISS
jgi:Glycosyltransferase family 87